MLVGVCKYYETPSMLRLFLALMPDVRIFLVYQSRKVGLRITQPAIYHQQHALLIQLCCQHDICQLFYDVSTISRC